MSSASMESSDKVVEVKEKTRLELLRFYDSKSTAHIGYLIATILAFISLQTSLVGKSVDPVIIAIGIALFFALGSYFLGRAFYWTLMSTATFWFKAYSVSYQEERGKELKMKEFIQYSEISRLGGSITNYYLKKGLFENNEYCKRNNIFLIFYSRRNTLVFLILIFVVSFLVLIIMGI